MDYQQRQNLKTHIGPGIPQYIKRGHYCRRILVDNLTDSQIIVPFEREIHWVRVVEAQIQEVVEGSDRLNGQGPTYTDGPFCRTIGRALKHAHSLANRLENSGDHKTDIVIQLNVRDIPFICLPPSMIKELDSWHNPEEYLLRIPESTWLVYDEERLATCIAAVAGVRGFDVTWPWLGAQTRFDLPVWSSRRAKNVTPDHGADAWIDEWAKTLSPEQPNIPAHLLVHSSTVSPSPPRRRP